MQFLPAGDWHCPNCTCKFCGNGSDIAQEVDLMDYAILSCSLCEKKCTVFLFLFFSTLKFQVSAWFTQFLFSNVLIICTIADHKSCMELTEEHHIDSNSLVLPFCGQTCREVICFSSAGIMLLNILFTCKSKN